MSPDTQRNQSFFILDAHLHPLSCLSPVFLCLRVSERVCLTPRPPSLCFVQSDVSCLQLAEHDHLPVLAHVAVILLSIGVLLHLGQEVAVFILLRGRSSGLLQAGGGAAGFSDGRVGVIVEVAVGDGRLSPAGFTPRRFPLSPLPPQCCLGLDINNDSQVSK